MKRYFALLLSALLLLGLCVPVGAAAGGSGTKIPTVYIVGKGNNLCRTNEAGEKEFLYRDDRVPVPDGYIAAQVKALLPQLLKAVVTDDYNDYCAALVDSIASVYTDFIPDPNGEVTDGSNCDWSWYPGQNLRNRISGGFYALDAYSFHYDWRRSPLETADRLAAYIADVCRATGAGKVHVVSRCLGCCELLAYMSAYGCEKLESIVLYDSSVSGLTVLSEIFSGKISISDEAAEQFAMDYFLYGSAGEDLLGSRYLSEFLAQSVSLLQKTYGLKLPAAALQQLYQKLSAALPEILISSFAALPAYWAMVCPADYAAAKKLVFAGKTEEYAGLIEKIDAYHYTVQRRAERILTAAADAGVSVYNISKYGFRLVPLVKSNTLLSDREAALKDQTMGAACAPINGTLSSGYLARADETYISPDAQVDASTCLFPDTTWIIKNLAHGLFPAGVDPLICDVLNSGGNMTVHSDPAFPQYLKYDEESDTLSPLTGENSIVTRWNSNLFAALKNQLLSFFRLIRSLLTRTES